MLLIFVCVCVLLSLVIRDNLLLSSKAHDLRRSLDQLRGNPTLTMRREAMTGMQASSLSGGAVGMLLSCAICKLITLPQPNLNLRDGMEWMNINVNLWGLYLSSKKICMVIRSTTNVHVFFLLLFIYFFNFSLLSFFAIFFNFALIMYKFVYVTGQIWFQVKFF